MTQKDGRRKILLIDDEAELVEILKDILVADGYEVESAQDGKEGLFKAERFQPDLIILDVNMPKVGGISFYSKIANSYDGKPKFPILVLTGRPSLEEVFRGLAIDGFLTKPFDIDTFLREVARIIHEHATGESIETAAAERMQNQTRIQEDEIKRKVSHMQRKILIVEDDSESFDKIVRAFINAGYVTHAVKSGTQMLDRIERHKPDAILIQLKLHGLAGDILVTKLKFHPETSQIPIVLYSRSKDTRLDHNIAQRLAEKVGLEHFVESDDPDSLIKACERVLKEAA